MQAAVEEQEQDPRQVALDAWCAAGMGEIPLPESRAQWMELPLHVKAQVEAKNLGLFQFFNGTQPLPAALERKLALGGLDQLDPTSDGPVLEACGRLLEAQQLRDRIMAERIATFEEGTAAFAEASQQQQEQWAAAQAAGMERAQAAARSEWVGSLGGRPNPLVADAIRLGALAPGVR
jgi:hypothetical protein